MKTSASFSVKGRYVFFATCIVILSSCHTYQPLVRTDNVSHHELTQKIQTGKRYAIITNEGQTVYMKVEEITLDRLTGDARIKTGSKTVYTKNHTVFFDAIQQVSERKEKVVLTLGAIMAALATMGLMFTDPFTGEIY